MICSEPGSTAPLRSNSPCTRGRLTAASSTSSTWSETSLLRCGPGSAFAPPVRLASRSSGPRYLRPQYNQKKTYSPASQQRKESLKRLRSNVQHGPELRSSNVRIVRLVRHGELLQARQQDARAVELRASLRELTMYQLDVQRDSPREQRVRSASSRASQSTRCSPTSRLLYSSRKLPARPAVPRSARGRGAARAAQGRCRLNVEGFVSVACSTRFCRPAIQHCAP